MKPTQTAPVSLDFTSRPSAEPTAAPPIPWRVDVVNGPRRVIVSVSPGGLYFVEPNAHVTLFELPGPRPGGIELIEATNDGCILLDKAPFAAQSFTLKLIGGPTGPYTVDLVPGTTLTGPPTAERTTECMG